MIGADVRRVILVGLTAATIVAGTAHSAIADPDESHAFGRPRCTPGYQPCMPNRPTDVDCYGGGGNGPRYTRPGVEYRVRGGDRYELDGDNDRIRCEQ